MTEELKPITRKVPAWLLKEAFRPLNEAVFKEFIKNPFIKAIREDQNPTRDSGE
jgi:hypothetical protein